MTDEIVFEKIPRIPEKGTVHDSVPSEPDIREGDKKRL
jgi:hypothetical protein